MVVITGGDLPHATSFEPLTSTQTGDVIEDKANL
jgi:hypothetical protein